MMCFVAQKAGQQVIRELIGPEIIDKAIVVDGAWDHTRVREMFSSFHASHRNQYRVYRLTVALTKDAASNSRGSK